MNMDFRIIPADTELIPQMLKIENASFSDPWKEELFNFYFSARAGTVLAAVSPVSELELFGFIAATIVPPECFIDSVAVAPEHRRKGIAKALLAAVGGDFEVTLEVRESNLAARELYYSLGFELLCVRKNYYDNPTENALVLRKNAVGHEKRTC